MAGIATHEQTAPATLGDAVYPRDRVFPAGLGIIGQPEKIVQVVVRDSLGVQPWSGDTSQLYFSLRNYTGQAQPPHCG